MSLSKIRRQNLKNIYYFLKQIIFRVADKKQLQMKFLSTSPKITVGGGFVNQLIKKSLALLPMDIE